MHKYFLLVHSGVDDGDACSGLEVARRGGSDLGHMYVSLICLIFDLSDCRTLKKCHLMDLKLKKMDFKSAYFVKILASNLMKMMELFTQLMLKKKEI